MIAYLRGTLQSRDISSGPADRIVIDVAGVGFEVTCAHRTALGVGELGDCVVIHTALSIRENDWTIFGFASREEREMFGLLQSVSGVGPKLALALVGTLGPDQIAEAVVADDPKMLSQAPGVGLKVAQRIILELKPKMEDWHRQRGIATIPSIGARSRFIDEARSILEGLGYTPTEIDLAFKEADTNEIEDVEMLVRSSLKILGAAGR